MRQIPCVEKIKKTDDRVMTAIGVKDAIWKQGQKGTITISFKEEGAWSYIGSQSMGVRPPSMNLGFIDPPFAESFTYKDVTYKIPKDAVRNYCGDTRSTCRRNWLPGATIVHEFGHALGMSHEHQNNLFNKSPVKLSPQEVIRWYNCGQGGEESAQVNVLDMYENPSIYEGTTFDKFSIMLYEFPNAWISGCPPYDSDSCERIYDYREPCTKNPTRANFRLSRRDLAWLKTKYPKNPNIGSMPELTVKFVDRSPEPWKVAWVEKTVLEAYKDIGIVWKFETNFGKESFESVVMCQNDDKYRIATIILSIILLLIVVRM